jgi:hypothetical protein
MSVQLEIRDGNPWWLSPDIWTVPGDDPEGPAGVPIVGSPAYMWASVRNNGNTAVANATVRFYWANPSVGFDRNTANPIGSAFVSLDPGEAQDVLCLTPWIPAFVNGGHECVLAEAFHSSDPLPAGPAFNVSTDRHVAQRNLDVVMALKHFTAPFEIHNASRKSKAFRLEFREGELRELKALAPYYGKLLQNLKPGKVGNLRFTESVCSCEENAPEKEAHEYRNIQLPAGARTGLALTGDIEGGAALIHIRQFEERREVGGLSVLVIHR